MKRQQRITAKQEAFAHAIVDGKKPFDAYSLAYQWNGKPAVKSQKAQEVLNHPLVVEKIAALKAKLETPKTLDRQKKRELLARFVLSALPKRDDSELDPEFTPEQLRAIEIDNRMAGHNEAEKLKVTGLGSVLQKIRAAAPKP